MAQMHDGRHGLPDGEREEDLEQLLSHGVTLDEDTQANISHTTASHDEEDENTPLSQQDAVQGALAIFAEAAQDMATASVELSLGRHFACADFCNQSAEKAAQAVSMLRLGRRSPYNHDLRALSVAVGAPLKIQDEMAVLTPFHPEAFYMETPPEEADDVISAEQATDYVGHARSILRWARSIVLNA
jgi:HEPN domain-containing protein